MHLFKTLTLLLLLALTTMPVLADTELTFNRASLNVSATEEVRADTIIGNLGLKLQGKDSSQIVDEVNTRIGKAMQALQEFKKIDTETLNYNTRPIYQNGRHSGLYEVSQSIRIKSQDFEQFTQAVQKLQAIIDLQSVSYQLSKQARSESEDRLTRVAIQRFTQRAKQISKDFGFSDYRIVNVNIGGNPQYRAQNQRMSMMSEDKAGAPPVFQAGEQDISVSVNGMIEMSR